MMWYLDQKESMPTMQKHHMMTLHTPSTEDCEQAYHHICPDSKMINVRFKTSVDKRLCDYCDIQIPMRCDGTQIIP
jgi:hypothetical protein